MIEAEDSATVAELRRRLAEAEETIRAIREGEVDALVVRGRDQDEVFTLEGGTESYRIFMEAMDTGAAAVDGAGRLLYANGALCRLLGQSLEAMQGKELARAFSGAAGEAITGLVAALAGEASAEIALAGHAGEVRLIATARPLHIGLVSGRAITFADITERARAAAVAESERTARAIIASANEAVLVCDAAGVITHVNAATRKLSAEELIGRRFADAVALDFPPATGLQQSGDLVARAISGESVQGIEAVAPAAPRIKDYLISAAPLRLADDLPSGCVVTMVDLTQRKAAEKQQLLLMAELDHRVKNTLALVLSISGRTLSNEDTLEGFQSAFTGRIQALAATHTMLAEKSWKDLSIADVVRAELRPYVAGAPGRVIYDDLDHLVAPRAAIALGLIFHELATNAAKYGALSSDAGHVTVRARPGEGEHAFTVVWTETDGPRVNPPSRRGFGHTVISRSLQYSPEGGADLSFDPAGLRCDIHVPAEDLVG